MSARSVAVRIESLAPTGEGVARLPDGRVVFVPRTLPHEWVEITVSRRRGRLQRVLEPSPARVEPSCSIAHRCGGCDHMHVSSAAQPELHAEVVRSVIGRALGSVERLPSVTSHTPQPPLQYRTRARLHLRAQPGHPARAGFLASRSHRLVDALGARCPLLPAELLGAALRLRDGLTGAGQGEAQLACGRAGLPVIALRWRGELSAATYAALTAEVDGGRWAGLELSLEGAREPLRAGDPRPWQIAGDGQVLVFPPGGFSQPSAAGGNALAAHVAELLAQAPHRRIVELFAGSGTLSVALAPLAEQLVAVEQSAAAAACLRDNLARRQLKAKIHVTDASCFPLPRAVAAVVLDPPRGGALEAVTSLAAERRGQPRTVIYASCEPTTLARDLAVLCRAGYELSDLDTFELFPQTSRVETVVRLVRS